jgi:hypothetical protein
MLLRKRLGGIFIAFILIAALAFLALDVGFALYKNDRFEEASPVCTLNILSGDVTVLPADAFMWEEAEDGMVLDPGSRVRTAGNAYASLAFSEGTTTSIQPGTDIIIDQLGNGDSTQANSILLKQRSGKTWNQVAKRSGDDSTFQIQTPSASIAVHGTLFSTEVDESGATLVQTAEGLVNVSAEGEAVLVSEGQQTTVYSGAPPAIPSPAPPAENELLFTIDASVYGHVTSPGGASTGVLPDGSAINQIFGSRILTSDDMNRMILISEPDEGEYSVVLFGDVGTSGTYTIEGFSGGERTFTEAGSANITSEEGMVLKLHLDVIDGLIKDITELTSNESSEQDAVISSPEDGDSSSQVNKKNSEQETPWYQALGSYSSSSWIVIVSIVALFALIFILVWKRT